MGCGRRMGALPRDVFANKPSVGGQYVSNRISNTKYTLLTFIPKNLMEQFRLAMNQYFLFIAVLQLWSTITPVNPATTWGPLIIIFTITAVKEALDDIGRAKRDKVANSRRHCVLRGGREVSVSSAEILVGDIVKLGEDEEVPCDLVVLSTSEANGNCFIQTTNLDGESNYKSRVALKQTRNLTTVAALSAFTGYVHAPPPDEKLYTFDAQMRVTPDAPDVVSVGPDQLLLQATHVRNTQCVYGLAVYTGNETKFGHNKSTPQPKLTATDLMINKFSAVIFLFQLTLVIVFGIVGNVWEANNGRGAWYLGYSGEDPGYQFIIIPLRFLLLNSTMIPISLKVTLDLCKLYYAKFVNNDIQLYHQASNKPAEANSTALGEDLGQIQYVLSDKTGTLTENVMMLKCASINGIVYGTFDGDTLSGVSETPANGVLLDDPQLHSLLHNHDFRARAFMQCLALNNSVIPEQASSGRLVYKASSPDEEALVKAAAAYGVPLQRRDIDQVTINMLGTEEVYTQLHELEFSSARKRMSVLVRNNATNSLRLYVKGADDVVLGALRPGDPTLPRVKQQIDALAAAGLRTLVVAYKDLTEAEYQTWHALFHRANTAMKDRQQRKWEAYDRIETGLTLLGATAIEDKLQPRVPETIHLLKRAGLRIWMLTGDKPSTALTIALTCSLMPKSNMLRGIEGEDKYEVGRQIEDHLAELRRLGAIRKGRKRDTFTSVMSVSERNINAGRAVQLAPMSKSVSPGGAGAGAGAGAASGRARPPSRDSGRYKAVQHRKFTVMIKGNALEKALEFHRASFAMLAMAADSVICCRVTPQQKAQLVQVVKDHGQLTLAIGDGGNDVSMIQTAHIGVGIRGKEGLEASRAADYQVAQFKTLERLLMIHGRWAYYRTALVAQYSFYKSFMFCFMQIAYTWHTGFAGTSIFNSLCVAAYNAILFVPIVLFCVDKDVSERTVKKFPQSYIMGQRSDRMNWRTMGWWFVRALYQAAALMWVVISGVRWTMENDQYETVGLVLFSTYLMVQSLTMVFELRNITARNLLTIFGMHAFALAGAFLMQLMSGFKGFIDTNSFSHALSDPAFYVINILGAAVCVLPVEIVKCYLLHFVPSPARHLLLRDIRKGDKGSQRPLRESGDATFRNPAHGKSPRSPRTRLGSGDSAGSRGGGSPALSYYAKRPLRQGGTQRRPN